MTSSTNNNENALNSLQPKPCKPTYRVWYYKEVGYLHANDLFCGFILIFRIDGQCNEKHLGSHY